MLKIILCFTVCLATASLGQAQTAKLDVADQAAMLSLIAI
jgi:hypothetical protein